MFDNQVATIDIDGRAARVRIDKADEHGLHEAYAQTLARAV
jgi:hypothetical protein